MSKGDRIAALMQTLATLIAAEKLPRPKKEETEEQVRADAIARAIPYALTIRDFAEENTP